MSIVTLLLRAQRSHFSFSSALIPPPDRFRIGIQRMDICPFSSLFKATGEVVAGIPVVDGGERLFFFCSRVSIRQAGPPCSLDHVHFFVFFLFLEVELAAVFRACFVGLGPSSIFFWL